MTGKRRAAPAPMALVAYHFEGAKTHIMAPAHVNVIVADLLDRGHAVESHKTVKEAGVDYGGMMIAGRPWEEFRLRGGFILGMPSAHVKDFAERAARAEVRCSRGDQHAPGRCRGVHYVKLHSYWNCVVLTPAQRDQFVAAAARRLPAADARYEAFMTECTAMWAAQRAKGGRS